jgi:hypothetical protein
MGKEVMASEYKIPIVYANAIMAGVMLGGEQVWVVAVGLVIIGLIHAVCLSNAEWRERFLCMSSLSPMGTIVFWALVFCFGEPGIYLGAASIVLLMLVGFSKKTHYKITSDVDVQDEKFDKYGIYKGSVEYQNLHHFSDD